MTDSRKTARIEMTNKSPNDNDKKKQKHQKETNKNMSEPGKKTSNLEDATTKKLAFLASPNPFPSTRSEDIEKSFKQAAALPQKRTTTYNNIPTAMAMKHKTPFKEGEVFGDNEKTIHHLCRLGKGMIIHQKNESVRYEPTVQEWKDMFAALTKKKQDKNDTSVWAFGLRLSSTSPEVFGPALNENGSLEKRADTTAWVAANELFGSNWRFTKTLTNPTNQLQQSTLNYKNNRNNPTQKITNRQSKQGSFPRKEIPSSIK